MTESVQVNMDLASRLVSGERRALARAITLIESKLPADRSQATALLKKIYTKTGNALRIGVSGVPGAGKSTFIEAFGRAWIKKGRRVAVLAVDPSSQRSGGSILGDKTRMQELGSLPQAFIRPSPSGGAGGGVGKRTRETILLCEAAGFDIIIVETVGVGQSEVAVHSMTDLFLLLMLPNTGDELQGMKKGILELVDIIVVNKMDIDLAAARRAQSELGAAMHMVMPQFTNWTVPVQLLSALQEQGFPELFKSIDEFCAQDRIENKRKGQLQSWFEDAIKDNVERILGQSAAMALARERFLAEIAAGQMLPEQAAQELVDSLFASILKKS